MPRRTRSLTLTLLGPSMLAAGCGGGAPAPQALPAEMGVAAELGPNEERALAAALGANAVGNAAAGPLPALPLVIYSYVTSEPPAQTAGTRRYPSTAYRRASTYIAPYYWTTSRYHAPAVYRPGLASYTAGRPAATAGRPATSSTTTRGGFGAAGRSASS